MLLSPRVWGSFLGEGTHTTRVHNRTGAHHDFNTTPTTEALTVTIIPVSAGAPKEKLAEAELLFHEGPMAGLKLVGFTVWESRKGDGHSVTFPARSYTKDGEKRQYQLLRRTGDNSDAAVKDLILAAYAAHPEEGDPA